jgi:DNA adenine methylase
MKPLLSYFGGKQHLAAMLHSVSPKHYSYIEPFAGAAAYFFYKPPSQIEVLNDNNGMLINFYQVIKLHFDQLQAQILATLHSRAQHDYASVIYNYPQFFDQIKRAWATWVLCNQSFGGNMDDAWGYDVTGNASASRIAHKKEEFTEKYAKRMERVTLENDDALNIIKSRDSNGTFFYLDPPYIDTRMGHYKGYTAVEFENLLETLCRIKGKFLLSTYPSHLLDRYTADYKWSTLQIPGRTLLGQSRTPKMDVLTSNYPWPRENLQLF